MSQGVKSMTRTTGRLLAVLVATAIAVASCSNDSGKGSAPRGGPEPGGDADGSLFDPSSVNKPIHEGTPATGGSLSFGLEADVLNISPNMAMVQPSDVQVGSAVYDALIGFDDDGLAVTDDPDHAHNQLAESLTASEDLKTWTLKLRDDVKFSNGVPLTAEQVVDHTEWVKASGTCDCDPDAQRITAMTTPDEHTVVYRLETPVVDWPVKLTRGGLAWITESGARATADDPSQPAMANLVGTGAFVFAEKSGDSYRVTRNEHYYGVDHENGDAPLPYLDEITFTPLADSVTRLKAVQSDGVQIMQTADTANLIQAKKDSSLGVQPAQGTSATIVGLNLIKEPFGVAPGPDESAQDTAVRSLGDATALKARQAFNLALNRNEINQKSYEGTRVPAYGFIPPTNPWYDPDAQLPRFDLASATGLVSEVEGAGATTDIELLCIDASQARAMLELVQQQLEAAGFTVKLHSVTQATLIQNLLGGSDDIDWNASCFRAPQFIDPNALTNALQTAGPTNFVKYSDPDVDQWLEQGRETGDFAARKKIYDKIQEKLASQVVYLPTLFDYYGNVFRDGVSGLTAPSPISLGIIAPGALYRVR